MNSRPDPVCEIRPASPGQGLDDLLALVSSRTLSLPSGGSLEGYAGDQCCCLVGAVQGTVTVVSYAQSDVLAPGQALALWQCGAFTLHSVGESRCVLLQLRGELPGRVLARRLTDGVALFPKGAPAVREVARSLSVLEEEGAPASGAAASAYAYTMLAHLISGPAAAEDGRESALSALVEAAVGIIQEEFPFLEGLEDQAQRRSHSLVNVRISVV